MAIKHVMKSLIGKKEAPVHTTPTDNTFLTSADFPFIHASSIDLKQYEKIPLMSLSSLGAAFSTLPEAARTITTNVTTHVNTGTPVFAGLWPKGVTGKMVDKGLGFSGNITGLDNSKVVGRMRYKLIDNGMPITTTTNSVVPFNPMTMIVASALVSIEKKLNVLQEKAEAILQFLTLEKQSRQRGNLNMLTEIMEEYKQDCNNEKMCALRVIAVQDMKRESHHDILFYQEQIAKKLQGQKAVHGQQKAKELLDAVTTEFYEYQLASYLYAYTSFMEVLLQKNFEAIPVIVEKLSTHAKKYADLYAECRSHISNYQRTSIEAQLIGGFGRATKAVGEKISSVPILSKSQVDEVLINVGESIGKHNKDNITRKVEMLAPLEDCHMHTFIDNMRRLDLLCNRPDGLLTDGEFLYILEVQ